ncbi:MAG: hypothetical protein JJE21_03775 [Spirochaetaceae bacterium]|nr:hypothetical protein [Spirochaetaceae bacterium]
MYSLFIILRSVIVIANFTAGQLMKYEVAKMKSIVDVLIDTIVNILVDPKFFYCTLTN